MRPGTRFLVQWVIILAALVALFMFFPSALRFVEMGARELRYLWWLVLLVALAIWLIWKSKRRS